MGEFPGKEELKSWEMRTQSSKGTRILSRGSRTVLTLDL